jgi:hypothetical protein
MSIGFLPYVGGGLLVLATRDTSVLIFAGVLITIASTFGAYIARSRRDPVTAKHLLIADPFLYGSEYALTVVLIRYVFMR